MAMAAANSYVMDVLVRCAKEAMQLCEANEKATLSASEIQAAVRGVIGGELAKHAVNEGFKAVTKFGQSNGSGGQTVTRSAGLQFPVPLVVYHLKQIGAQRIGDNAPVYLAAVCEYMTAELLELTGNAALDDTKKRINPKHIQLAICADPELNQFCKKATQ